jgi:hypothetical protein
MRTNGGLRGIPNPDFADVEPSSAVVVSKQEITPGRVALASTPRWFAAQRTGGIQRDRLRSRDLCDTNGQKRCFC